MEILKIEELQKIYKNDELQDNFKELIFNKLEDEYLTFNLESGSPKSKSDVIKMFSDKLDKEIEKIHENSKNTNKETYYQLSVEPDDHNNPAVYITCKAFKKRTISEFISIYYDKLKKEIEEEELKLKIEKDKIELFKQENSKRTLELEKMIKNGEV